MTTTTPTREPARILEPGTFPLPGFAGCSLTYGHDAVLADVAHLKGQPWLAVDIEGEGLGVLARNIKCVTLAGPNHAWLFDPRDNAQWQATRDIFTTVPELVLHNSPFDVPQLAHNGLLTETDVWKVFDTLIWARLAEPDDRTSKTLANVVARYLGAHVENGVAKRAKNLGLTIREYFRRVDLNSPAYRWDAASDAIATARLRDVVREAAYTRITSGHPFTQYGVTGAEAWRLVDREQIINRMMLSRTVRGLRWDPEYLDAYRDAKAKDIATWEAKLERAGIRPGVSADLVKHLDGIGQLPDGWPRTATGQLSGAKDHIKTLDHPLAVAFRQHKEAVKIDKDYLSKVAHLADASGRIHPTVNILGAASTGRMSIGDPPLQQFDAEARGIILADEGDALVSIDWSQIEPVTAANIAGDATALHRYEDVTLSAEERDVYLTVAAAAGSTRSHAKIILLAAMYGQGLTTLALGLGLITSMEAGAIRAKQEETVPGTDPARTYFPLEAAEALGIEGLAKAAEIQETVFSTMPRTRGLINRVKAIAKEYGVIFTVSGRILPIPKASYHGKWGYMAHKGPNYHIQGSAYDLLAETLIRVNEAGLSDAVYLAMHDELVVSRSAAHDVRRIMETPPERLCWMAKRTPILRTDMADLGERWAKC